MKISCSSCQQSLRLPNSDLAGKKVRCPKCGAVITVPAEAAPPVEEVPLPVVLAPASPAERSRLTARAAPVRFESDDDDRPAPRRRDRYDDDEPRPRRRRREQPTVSGSTPVVYIVVGVVVAVFVVCGGAIALFIGMINAVVSEPTVVRNNRVGAKNNVKNVNNAIPPAQIVGKGQVHEVGGVGLRIVDRLAVGDARDVRGGRNLWYCKTYQVRMIAGKNYVIRMNADNQDFLDALLRVENSNLQQLAFNDDDLTVPDTLDSRIDFRCTQSGIYRVIATSNIPDEVGGFTLVIQAN